ncbi:MAG: alpha/beta hydrolase [Verrucomicrobiota bacterium]
MLPGLKKHAGSTLALVLLIVGNITQAGARLDVIEFSSHTLQQNPLHDPAVRRVAVFVPDQITNHAGLPVVYYLPGFGGSSEKFIRAGGQWRAFAQRLADEVAPVLLVVVDGRNRWGGSQYLNSSAQGNYADYICDEIVPMIEARYQIATNQHLRIIAGHSSGGFGALRLGMMRPELFAGVIALSPDSDFPLSHLPLVKSPGITNVLLKQIKSCMAAEMNTPAPTNGSLIYVLGLSAAYAPVGRSHPGEFEWLFDDRGRFREQVWQRWLDNDPLTLVQNNPDAFRPEQAIYLDGAAQDAFKANVGARKLCEALAGRPERCAFYEPPGKHSDHIPERLARGLAWFFHRPTLEIK